MKLNILFILLSFFISPRVFTQSKTAFSKPDNIAKTAPDSVERNPEMLASYFRSELTTQRDLIRAIYFWTAINITYDVENMYTASTSDNAAAVILKTMGDRKAVCQGYAEVFHELSALCGITSYVIRGYTRQNGIITGLPHAWVVAIVDSNWYFFDPTWAAGYIANGKFVKRFTEEYFMVSPERQIRSHMPYDPIWQCLYHPFTASDFYNGRPPAMTDSARYSFPDSIALFLGLSKEQQDAAMLRRLEKNGIINNTLFDYARYLRHNIEVYKVNREIEARNQEIAKQREAVERFNQAAGHYNLSVNLFNDYINYYNRQFKPAKPDAEIRQMVDTCDNELKKSADLLAGLSSRDENMKENKAALTRSIFDMQKKVNDQKLFLQNYFATSKSLRSSQFRKYTFFGVPIN